mmetsp:Transcript_15507/g.44094  ORF Transcript_15507/g.44094 Transcript_15507/m.44094 type:complete len:360 (-) Transcript_15507:226-1305(-)
MDLENLRPALQVGQTKLDLPVQASRTQQRRVQRIRPVGCHQHFDVSPRVESIQLVHNLKHGSLHLVVPALIIPARPADRVHLVEENDARLLRPRHLKQLTHHPRTLSDVFLNQLTSDHTDEARVRAVRDGPRQQRLASPRRTVQQDSLRWVDTKLDKLLRMQHGDLDHLPHLFNLLLAPANVAVGDVRFLLDGHHRDRRVDFRRQRNLDLILLPIHADPHPLLDVRWCNLVPQAYHELCNLLDVDQVLGVFRIRIDDLRAPTHLQRLLLLHHLFVGHKIPPRRMGEARVRLFDAREFVHLLRQRFDLHLQILDLRRVRPGAVRLHDADVLLGEGLDGLVVIVSLLRRVGFRRNRHDCWF